MSDIYTLASKYLSELNLLDSRVTAVNNSVRDTINKAERCLNDWNRLKNIADDISSGISMCLTEIHSMDNELSETVKILNHLSKDIFEIEHQIIVNRNDVSNLEAHYLATKKEIENIYLMTMTILDELSKTLGYDSNYLLAKYIKKSEIDSFLHHQNNTLRFSLELKTPLFESIEIPNDLLFESSKDEHGDSNENKDDFSKKSTHTHSKNQQENA